MFTIAPIPNEAMLAFLFGAVLLIVGMGLFTLGADTAMTPIGEYVGSSVTRSKRVWFIVGVALFVGIMITVSEPDLQVLAETVPHIDNTVLLITVGLGVGFFLAVSMLRIMLGIKLRWLLLLFYGIVFALAVFTNKDFLGAAFDSGGVTTGPMTVPFILAFGMGVANIRSDKHAESDSFGLVALCSIGPIIAVLLLSFFYPGVQDGSSALNQASNFADTMQIGRAYIHELPRYFSEVAISLAPILIIFLLFQVFSFKLSLRRFGKICIGFIYTYLGLVLFLTGVHVGFSQLGTVLGAALTAGWMRYLLIPIAMVLGYLPFLLLVSLFSGALTGFVVALLFRAMEHVKLSRT